MSELKYDKKYFSLLNIFISQIIFLHWNIKPYNRIIMNKLISIFAIAILFSCTHIQPPVTISGFVYVSDSHGLKVPDKFAEVYIIEQTEADTIKVHDFFSNMLAYRMIKSDYISAVAFEKPEVETLKAKLDKIDEVVASAFVELKSHYVTTKLACNAIGEFTCKVKPAKYFFIAKSNTVVYPTLLDCYGAVSCTPVTVKKEKNETVMIDF